MKDKIFNLKQQKRVALRSKKQRDNAKLMTKLGGYNSTAWGSRNDRVAKKVNDTIIKQKIISEMQKFKV